MTELLSLDQASKIENLTVTHSHFFPKVFDVWNERTFPAKNPKWPAPRNIEFRRRLFISHQRIQEQVTRGEIFVDYAASTSPLWLMARENFDIFSYRHDFRFRPEGLSRFPDSPHDDTIGGELHSAGFMDHSVAVIALNSGIQYFKEDQDIEFVLHCARYLRPGGVAIIPDFPAYTESGTRCPPSITPKVRGWYRTYSPRDIEERFIKVRPKFIQVELMSVSRIKKQLFWVMILRKGIGLELVRSGVVPAEAVQPLPIPSYT